MLKFLLLVLVTLFIITKCEDEPKTIQEVVSNFLSSLLPTKEVSKNVALKKEQLDNFYLKCKTELEGKKFPLGKEILVNNFFIKISKEGDWNTFYPIMSKPYKPYFFMVHIRKLKPDYKSFNDYLYETSFTIVSDYNTKPGFNGLPVELVPSVCKEVIANEIFISQMESTELDDLLNALITIINFF